MAKKVLIVSGGWDGHEPVQTSEIFRKELTSAGFDVKVETTLDALLDDASKYDLIIPNWTMGQISGPQENALLDAAKSGVGVAGFHGGMGDAFRVNTTYQFMVGGQFVAHPDDHRDYVVNIVSAKKDDPIVAGLKDFKFHSEQYYMHVDPSNEVLATTTFNTVSAPWVNGTVMPVVWKRKYGAGKIFYSSLGHNAQQFDVPEVREITKRGMIWAAR